MIATPTTLRRGLYFWAYLARSRAGFRFDLSRGEYIWNANGRTVLQPKLEIESGHLTKRYEANMRFQTQRHIDGKISLPQWQRNMRKELRDSWRTQYALGKGGWDQMTQADFGRMGGRLQAQYRHLNGFAGDMFQGRLTEKQALARASMYSTANRTALFDGETAAKVAAGLREERRVLNPAEHCPDCVGYANEGWVAIGSLPEPGVASVCLSNCKCEKQYRSFDDESTTVGI